MLELFGVLTAAVLSCTGVESNCAPRLETQGHAVIEQSPDADVAAPAAKPRRQAPAVKAASKPAKRKIEVVLVQNDAVRKPVKRSRIPLIIGNFY